MDHWQFFLHRIDIGGATTKKQLTKEVNCPIAGTLSAVASVGKTAGPAVCQHFCAYWEVPQEIEIEFLHDIWMLFNRICEKLSIDPRTRQFVFKQFFLCRGKSEQ